MSVFLRYLPVFLLSCATVSAAQNPPEPAKPRYRDVPVAVPTDAKPQYKDVLTAVPTDAKSPVGNPPPAAVVAPAAANSGVTITAEQWARPRSGDSIVKLPGLDALVEATERDAASRLVIRFAGGDEGSLWAEELRSWLVALGLPSARVALEPGLPQSDRLLLELRPPR